eukprot:scaffold1459_cov260-Pinguiococcus_pyrenoidosus.AAC.21
MLLMTSVPPLFEAQEAIQARPEGSSWARCALTGAIREYVRSPLYVLGLAPLVVVAVSADKKGRGTSLRARLQALRTKTLPARLTYTSELWKWMVGDGLASASSEDWSDGFLRSTAESSVIFGVEYIMASKQAMPSAACSCAWMSG